jgi:hypothetical protein
MSMVVYLLAQNETFFVPSKIKVQGISVNDLVLEQAPLLLHVFWWKQVSPFEPKLCHDPLSAYSRASLAEGDPEPPTWY